MEGSIENVSASPFPAAVDVEAAVLGAIIRPGLAERGEALSAVSVLLSPEHFFKPAHRTVYEAILALHNRGAVPDVLSVLDELETTGKLDKIGGRLPVMDIAETVFTDANAAQHARIVLEKARLRRLADLGSRLASLCSAKAIDVDEAIDGLTEELHQINSHNERQIRSSTEVALETMQRLDDYKLGKPSVIIPTPLVDLNRLVTGLRPSEVFVIAARPGFGKSSLAHAIAINAAAESVPVGIITLEMSDNEVQERMACSIARVDSKLLREGRLGDAEFKSVTDSLASIGSLPLYFDQSVDLDPQRIRAVVRRMAQSHGVKLVILDHIQLVSGPRRAENRQQEMTAISRACKIAAKESDVAMLVLSQLNRAPDSRLKGRPQLSDLRESGAIEQDADVVLLIYYPHFYDKQQHPGEMEFIIAKHRNGPTGTFKVTWNAQYTRFDNYISDDRAGVDYYGG